MTSRTHDNFRHNFWTWFDPHPPPFEQCSKKLHFSLAMASLIIVILFVCSKYKVFWWLLKEWNERIWIVPQRRQFLVLLYLLIQNMCNSKLQSSNIVGDLVIVTVIGLGAPTCNIVGDLVTSRRTGVSLPQTKYMHRSDTTVEQGRYNMYIVVSPAQHPSRSDTPDSIISPPHKGFLESHSYQSYVETIEDPG